MNALVTNLLIIVIYTILISPNPILATDFPLPQPDPDNTCFEQTWTKRNLFVDRSLLIKTILESPFQVILAPFIRKSGKSVNIDMLTKFLTIEVDENGVPVPVEKRQYRKYFCSEAKDHQLQIASSTIHRHPACDVQGTFPVIRVTFKDIYGDSLENVLNDMRPALGQAFYQHSYMVEVLKARLQHGTTEDKALVIQQLDLFHSIYSERASEKEIRQSLRFLSELLRSHFNKRVFIFVDDYNAFLNQAYFRNIGMDKISDERRMHLERIVSLFADILGCAFNENDALQKGFITGIPVVGKEEYFLNASNVHEFNFPHPVLSKYFWFTQQDVEDILGRNNAANVDREAVKKYYDGNYVSGEHIYNTWSISKLLENNFKLARYWNEFFFSQLINRLLQFDSARDQLLALLCKPTTTTLGKFGLDVGDLVQLQQILYDDSKNYLSEYEFGLILDLLYFNGYLVLEDDAVRNVDRRVKIPNLEIRKTFQEVLMTFCTDNYGFEDTIRKNCAAKAKLMFVPEEGKRKDAEVNFAKTYVKHMEAVKLRRFREHAVKCTLFAIIESVGDDEVTAGSYEEAGADIVKTFQNLGLVFQIQWKYGEPKKRKVREFVEVFKAEKYSKRIKHVIVFEINVTTSMKNRPTAVTIQSVSFKNTDEDRQKFWAMKGEIGREY